MCGFVCLWKVDDVGGSLIETMLARLGHRGPDATQVARPAGVPLAMGHCRLAIIGAGVNPETITWGNVIQSGITDLTDAPNIVLAPSLVIFVTVMALNFLGDVLRAKFDVRESAL